MKYVLLNLLLLSNVCHSMEPENFKNIADLNDFENHMIENITGSTITSFKAQGSIVELQLNRIEDPASHQLIRFTRNYSKNGVLYLTPLHEDGQEPATLESFAWNYRLLALAEGGHLELIDKTLEHGATPLAPDQRLARPIFNIIRGNQKLYKREDLQNGHRPFRLTPSARPIIAVHPYSTYNLTAIEHAIRQCNLKTVETLRKTCENTLPDEVLARIQFDIKLDELLTNLAKEQTEIQRAQRFTAIPSFPILPASNSTDPFIYLTSEDDLKLKIRAHIDKDICSIEFQSDPSLWNTSYLDLDALSTLYAHLIFTNETEGSRVLDSFDKWSKYDLFTIRVIRYVLDNLKLESYDDQPFLPENITKFAQRIARYKNTTQQLINPLQSEHLVGMTLCVCAAKLSKPSDNNYEWSNATDALVKNLTSEPTTEQLCKKICDNNKPLFFTRVIKFSMKKALLQRYCARILSGAQPHLDNELIEHIISYWNPNDRFISEIKKDKEKPKKGSIKKTLHAIIHKK